MQLVVLFALLALLIPVNGQSQELCTDTVYAYVEGDTVFLHHDGAFYNCCAAIEFSVLEQDTIIDVIETETFPNGPCFCMCCFDLMLPIVGLPPGNYLIRVWNEDQSELYGQVWVTVGGLGTLVLGSPWQSPCLSEVCGDANADQEISLGDVTYLAAYLYCDGFPPLALYDPDMNGIWTQSDLVYLSNYLFAGGPEPCQVTRAR